tara:strand:- start:254 stop:403 length:150 start_codon:yes stop_codon:yes gene_type:complete
VRQKVGFDLGIVKQGIAHDRDAIRGHGSAGALLLDQEVVRTAGLEPAAP